MCLKQWIIGWEKLFRGLDRARALSSSRYKGTWLYRLSWGGHMTALGTPEMMLCSETLAAGKRGTDPTVVADRTSRLGGIFAHGKIRTRHCQERPEKGLRKISGLALTAYSGGVLRGGQHIVGKHWVASSWRRRALVDFDDCLQLKPC